MGLDNLADRADTAELNAENVSTAPLNNAPKQMFESRRGGSQGGVLRYVNPLHAPTRSEVKEDEDYLRDFLIGSTVGAAGGALTGLALKRNILGAILLGLGTGGAAGVVRSFDKRSDPPGLNPIYTVPSGARLGALTGAITGLGLGRATGFGMLPGLAIGTVSGTLGGALASPMM